MMYHLYFIILQCGFCVNGYFLESKSSKNSSTVVNFLMELLMDCDGFNSESIFIIGDMDNSPKKMLLDIGPTSLILMDDEMAEKSIPSDQIVSSVQTNLFIINTKSEEHLNKTINLLKSSSWWNIRGFYIIHTPFTTKNCDKAFNYLWIMWKMDLINVTFICHNVDEQMLMFTYNPYTNRAPDPWKILNNTPTNPPWTLLTLPYEKNPSICSSLTYDKTQKLDGYSGIRAAAFQTEEMQTLQKDDEEISNILFTSLNLTRKYDKNEDRGHIDGTGDVYGVITNLTKGDYDIIFNSRYRAYAKGLRMSSIILQSGVAIASQRRGNLSIIQKIIDYFPIWFFISILISIVATGLALKYSLKKFPICRGITEATALLLDTAPVTVSRLTSLRLFLFVIFFFVLIVQALFRGRILRFLTTPKPKHNINSLEDLIEFSDYKVYCDFGMRKYMPSELQDRCLDILTPNGLEKVLKNPQSCQVSGTYVLLQAMAKLKCFWLNLSPRVIKQYVVYMMRENWPLEDRLNQGLSRMFESGLGRFIRDRVIGDSQRKIERIKNQEMVTQFRAIKIEDLIFCFKIWAVGIGIAFAVFIIEMHKKIHKFFKKIFSGREER